MSLTPNTGRRRWWRAPLATFVPAAALLLFLPGALGAQLGAGVARANRLEPTSNSMAAVSEFNAGLLDLNNVQTVRAANHLRRSVDADPSLGIARVLLATVATDLNVTARDAEFARGIADAAKASAPEFLLASALRARFKNDFIGAQSLLQAAERMLPNDPSIAYISALNVGALPGSSYAATIEPLRKLTTSFPDFAPAFNQLAYNRWRSGDHAGALETVKMYVNQAPNEPNAHDSFGEILMLSGRFDEAVIELNKALDLDNALIVPAQRIACLRVIEGKGDLARTALNAVLPRAATPGVRISLLNQIAATFMLDGNAKLAMAQIETSIAEAQKANMVMSVSSGHATLAIIDALIGDGKSVGNHLSMVGDGVTAIDKAYYSGLAMALTKQNAAARSAVETLMHETMGKSTLANARLAPIINGLVLINEGKANDAIIEMNRTDLVTPLTRAVLALAHAKAGNLGLARSLRDEILGDRGLALTNGGLVTARVLVKRIT